MRAFRICLVLVCVGALCGTAVADTLLLEDGRIIDGHKMEHADKGVLVHFDNGDVLVPSRLIREAVLEDEPPYEPKDEAEKEKLAKGLVPFDGDWISPARRADLVAKRLEERRAEIASIREHSLWRNRYKERTAHFEFEYTVPPHVFEYYRDMMEVYYKAFAKTWRIKQPKDLGRLKVCFYTSLDDFHQIGGVGGGVQGYFRFVKPLELNFYFNRLDKRFTEEVMFHEANHYLQLLLDPGFSMPHFPGESIAEYYGASEFDSRSKKLGVGLILDGRLTEVQNDIAGDEMMPLQKLVSTSQMYEHYNWGWTLAHFLMNHKTYKKKFEKFVQTLVQGKDVKRVKGAGTTMTVEGPEVYRVFCKVLGLKKDDAVKSLEAEWHTYVKEELKLVTSSGIEKAATAAMNTNRPIRAKRLFREAIEKGSSTPMTYYRYAELLQRDGKHTEAIDNLKKAIELDPLAASFYASLGKAFRRKGDKEEGKRYLGLAKELDPDNPWLDIEIEDLLKEDGG